MFHLTEPQWGVVLSKSLHTWMQSSPFLLFWIPKFADLFVLTYPIYLLILYIYGMAKKQIYYKKAAIFIFIGAVLSEVVNILAQFFVDKVRPNVVLWMADLKTKSILHAYLPSSSFPSDHAALSMGIAITSLLRWMKNKDKKFLRFGWILVVFSLITWFCRITAAIHWPTDVIAGSILGIIVPLLLMNRKIYSIIEKFWTRIGKII